MKISIDATRESVIGKHGIPAATLTDITKRLPPLMKEIKAKGVSGEMPLFALVDNAAYVAPILQHAKQIAASAKDVVVLGTGGSSLSGQALHGLVLHRMKPGTVRLHFLDNTDGDSLAGILDQVSLSTTHFIVISKSGTTLETLTQCALCMQEVAQQKLPIAKHFTFITDPTPAGASENPLRQLAKQQQIMVLDHEPLVGGRFSTFTNVGLLPAALMGLDIAAIRNGASSVLKAALYDEDITHAACEGAALGYYFMQQKFSTTVLMPYADRLRNLARWYRQIWSESLGKNGHGNTPVNALGTIDQHSQLQLYLGGPKDKYFTFITLEDCGVKFVLQPQFLPMVGLEYLHGKSLDAVMAASAYGTQESMKKHSIPVRTIHLSQIDERTIGALMMQFILETVLVGMLLAINPFDQPAVEESKVIARATLKGV